MKRGQARCNHLCTTSVALSLRDRLTLLSTVADNFFLVNELNNKDEPKWPLICCSTRSAFDKYVFCKQARLLPIIAHCTVFFATLELFFSYRGEWWMLKSASFLSMVP